MKLLCWSRLSPGTESLVKIQYRRNVRQSSDPYKRAVYCIMAACDSQEEHGEIATSLGEFNKKYVAIFYL